MNARWLRFALAALAVCAWPTQAAFHLFRIDQVFSNADGSIQYVVMRESTGSNNENFWGGQSLRSVDQAGTSKQLLFPSNLPSSATASRSVLIATPGFAALGLVTPNYTMPAEFVPRNGGTLNFAGVDQISLPVLPIDGATAIDRNGAPVPATPRNFAGDSATVMLPPPSTSPNLNQHGLTGSWYEPATAGQGIELEVYPDRLGPGTGFFQGAWFTFDFDAPPGSGAERQRWYTFDGSGQSGMPSVPVTIYRNTGGNFNAPPATSATSVGSGTLSFSDCDTATLQYAFSGTGRAGSIPLTRLMRNVTCAVGGAPATNADFAFSGNWYDAAKDGQGFVFEVNPITPFFFLTWYTYAPNGQNAGAAGQRWYTGDTGQAPYTPGARTIALTLYETKGGAFDQPTTPAPATVAVGTATVTFTTCTAATITYNFTGGSSAGASSTIALTRVGPAPPGCVSPAQANNPPPSMMPPPSYLYPY
jgi:hypothetical protein